MYAGTFTIKAHTTHVALMLFCGTGQGMKPGQAFYLDDAEIVKTTQSVN